MKSIFPLVTILIISIILNSCFLIETDSGSDPGKAEFLVSYRPYSGKELGDKKQIVQMKIDDGEITYSSYLDCYPDKSIVKYSDINDQIVTIGLYWRDFNSNGIYVNLRTDHLDTLPLVEPTENDLYSYFAVGSENVTENGYIVYIAGTNNKFYGDELERYLVRYDPDKDKMIVAISPTGFALSQPEKGGDTDKGQYDKNIFASPDGKFAYGTISAFGTEAGGIHWDYDFLFKYEFESESYYRLGEEEDDDAYMISITSDGKYILYSNDGEYKWLNLEDNTVIKPGISCNNVNRNTSWNQFGSCLGETKKLVYKNFVSDEIITVVETKTNPVNPLFSADGSYIYFTLLENDLKYLCVTEGLTEGSTVDTLGNFPLDFYDMILVK